MSRPNKVNKDHYVQRGRLTPDDMARERMMQAQVSTRAKVKDPIPAKTRRAPGAPASTRPRNGRAG